MKKITQEEFEIPYKNRRSSLTEIKKTVKFYLDRKLIPNQALVKTKEARND